MQMAPLLGLSPDIDPTTPGNMPPGVGRFLPTQRGISGIPVFNLTGTDLVGSVNLRQHFVARYPSGGVWYFYTGESGGVVRIHNAQQLAASVGAFTDRSPGGAYTDAAIHWSFAQTADAVLVANGVNQVQISTGPSATFATVTTPPSQIPKIVSALNGFGFAFNGATEADRWYCSALGNAQDWAPSVTTQATTGRLQGGGGAIYAAAPLGDQMVAYKETEIWVGSYVGPPEVWRWQRIPAEGVSKFSSVVNIGTAHMYVGRSGAWVFDGVRPQPLGRDRVGSLMAAQAANTGPTLSLAGPRYDRANMNVYFPGGMVYNVPSGRWGYDSSFAVYLDSANGIQRFAIGANISNRQYRQPSASACEAFRFIVSGFGAADRMSMAREFRMLMPNDTVDAAVSFSVAPAGSIRAFNTKNTAASGLPSVTDDQGRIKVDLRQTAYWHHFEVQMSAPSTTAIPEVTAVGVDLVPVGSR